MRLIDDNALTRLCNKNTYIIYVHANTATNYLRRRYGWSQAQPFSDLLQKHEKLTTKSNA